MDEVIVDTNVPAVANGLATQADDACLRRCVAELHRIQNGSRLLLDDSWLILGEYQRNLGPPGRALPGDAFIKWALINQGNDSRIRRVPITPDPTRAFAEFPDDPGLASFDRADRKFVAVAVASGASPPIVNATDTDWWHHRDALSVHSVSVRFLCPELMTGR